MPAEDPDLRRTEMAETWLLNREIGQRRLVRKEGRLTTLLKAQLGHYVLPAQSPRRRREGSFIVSMSLPKLGLAHIGHSLWVEGHLKVTISIQQHHSTTCIENMSAGSQKQ